MAGRRGYRFDLYQISREEPEDPYLYLAVPAGRAVTLADLQYDRRGVGVLGIYPYDTFSEDHGACTICLEEITSESGFKVTLCNHSFHPRCLFRALHYEARCPNCRADLFIQL